MGGEGREEDRSIELAFLVRSTCDRAYAPALSTRCAPRRRSGRDRTLPLPPDRTAVGYFAQMRRPARSRSVQPCGALYFTIPAIVELSSPSLPSLITTGKCSLIALWYHVNERTCRSSWLRQREESPR